MMFSSIVGQPRATEALRQGLAAEKLYPSLIFHGPAGIGKLTTALELARAALCPSPEDSPCGRCSVCRRIDPVAHLHPDVRVVFPERLSDFRKGGEATERASPPRGRAPEEHSAAIDLQERQAVVMKNSSWTVLIDRVRQCIAALHRRPAEGKRSLLIIDQAHRMGNEAANAILKILEEPPPHAVIVLLTASLHALLPTIRSRCQAIQFQLVPATEIATLLVSRYAIDRDEARLRAALSGGRIGEAIDLDVAAFRARRETMLEILAELWQHADPGLAVARAEVIAKRGDETQADLEILMTLLRDLMILEASGGEATALINADIVPQLETLRARASAVSPRCVDNLDAVVSGIRQRGNRQLLIEDFLLDLLPGATVRPPSHSL